MKKNSNFDIKIDKYIEINILEVKEFANELRAHLDSKFPFFGEKISIVIANNTHKKSLDKINIGLINTFLELDEDNISAYEIYLNGEISGIKLSANNVKNFITGIVGDYEIEKKDTYNFNEYLKTILIELKD